MLTRNTTRSTIGGALALALLSTAMPVSGVMAQTGSLASFNSELQSRYARLANEEAEQKDDSDISLYRRKALDAGAGRAVQPESMSARQIEASKIIALTDARARLMTRLNGGYMQSNPADMAEAQVQWDCWLEQQEEGYQLMHIWRCQNGFEAAMARMDPVPIVATAPAPAVVAAPRPRTPDVHESIYFGFDSSELTDASLERLRVVVADMKGRGNPTIRIVGHTDTTGSAAYNQALSERRARALANYLDVNGIAVSAIDSMGVGEADLAVATGQDVRNSSNRRATMVIAGQ
ncbi:MAG: OmpA family protein [Pseudomonadota bacterium]|nr:OmpA family protein [Pseudomonadota bacterium]